MTDDSFIVPVSAIDMEKPEIKPGELLCGGCWAVSGPNKRGWFSFTFKYLGHTHLCPQCARDKGGHMCALQELGL